MLIMSILEAMSYGIPCISTDVGSIPSVIENGVNVVYHGRSFPANTENDFFCDLLHLSDHYKYISRELDNEVFVHCDSLERINIIKGAKCKGRLIEMGLGDKIVEVDDIVDIYE